MAREEMQAARLFFRIVSDSSKLTMILPHRNLASSKRLIFLQHLLNILLCNVNLFFYCFASNLPLSPRVNHKVLALSSATRDGRAFYCYQEETNSLPYCRRNRLVRK